MIFPIFLPPNRYPPLFVLDVSVAAAWAIPRHYTVYTNRVQFKLLTAAGLVTAAWAFEMADQLRISVQRGDTTQLRVDRSVATLAMLPIYVDDEGPFRTWPAILDLAHTHAISVHDAAHLELALRLNLPLATTDATLSRAAVAAGVVIFAP